jgi:TRAP transporter TAXI family solute receptor
MSRKVLSTAGPNGTASRRRFLAGVSWVGVGVTVAGCSEGTDPGGEGSDDTNDGGGGGDEMDDGDPVNLDFATFNEGTAWFVMGSAIADNMEERLPSGSAINVLPFAGTYGNIDLLKQDEADLAFGTEVVNKWARQGRFEFKDQQPFDDLRAIAGHLDVNWIPTAIREDVAEEEGIETYADIRENEAELSLGIGPGGSISHIAAEHLYGAHGFSVSEAQDWGIEVREFSLPDMPSAIASGEIDGLTYVSSPGHPIWTEITSENDIRFLPVENFEYLEERDWSEVDPLPEGMFGAAVDRPMMGFRSLVMTTPDLQDSIARAVAATLVEDRQRLVDAYASMEAFDPELGVQEESIGAPIHEGARAYFEAEGIL